MSWNHRVMRTVAVDKSGNTYVSYGIVEAHYDKKGDKAPTSWTEDYVGPVGESLPELVKDCAWIFKALTLPVLDHNGAECEPATMLADELQQWMDAVADTKDTA